ncbi:MAG: citrate (Si)-synthase [Anaerolineales bacterium]|nr:citrate (Si)-synthase [Anaerolineales bacterium]
MNLKHKIAGQLPDWRARVKKLLAESADVKVDEVNIGQIYGGMRNIKSLVTDISYVDPEQGIRLRGYTIDDLLEKLPKQPGHEIPLVGGLYYLLLVGEIPSLEEANEIESEWKKRSKLPGYLFDVLKAMPVDTHPMTLLSQGILALQRESLFAHHYHTGLKKDEYWDPMLEDSLNLTAKLPGIAAFIYRLKYKDGNYIAPDPALDFGQNFARMMGIEASGYDELTRLYMLLHSDHESGNVSAHATHLVGSALSDIYYALSAGMNGLAGPLHGLANQECLGWLLSVYDEFGGLPTKEQLYQYALKTLQGGLVIPGYGHAVLRKTDPRFSAQLAFGKKHFPEDQIFALASLVYDVVPDVLRDHSRTKDPWPNVDAISGSLQHHYGVREFDFLTVLFGVSRALGVTTNAVWARALGQPLERPKSLSTAMLEAVAAKAKGS